MVVPLYPTWTMPRTVEQRAQQRTPARYPRSFAFDFETGDFVLDGGGRVATVDGYEAWAVWCVKAVLTQRFAYLVYTPRYGCELDRVIGASRTVAEAEAMRVIREALLADPRTRAVSDFAFRWEGDALHVAFTVAPTVGTERRFSVRLTHG